MAAKSNRTPKTQKPGKALDAAHEARHELVELLLAKPPKIAAVVERLRAACFEARSVLDDVVYFLRHVVVSRLDEARRELAHARKDVSPSAQMNPPWNETEWRERTIEDYDAYGNVPIPDDPTERYWHWKRRVEFLDYVATQPADSQVGCLTQVAGRWWPKDGGDLWHRTIAWRWEEAACVLHAMRRILSGESQLIPDALRESVALINRLEGTWTHAPGYYLSDIPILERAFDALGRVEVVPVPEGAPDPEAGSEPQDAEEKEAQTEYHSVRYYAKKHGLNLNAFKRMIHNWRFPDGSEGDERGEGNGYIVNSTASSKEPRFLYLEDAIRDVINRAPKAKPANSPRNNST